MSNNQTETEMISPFKKSLNDLPGMRYLNNKNRISFQYYYYLECLDKFRMTCRRTETSGYSPS